VGAEPPSLVDSTRELAVRAWVNGGETPGCIFEGVAGCQPAIQPTASRRYVVAPIGNRQLAIFNLKPMTD
jgi:hypothetical protein